MPDKPPSDVVGKTLDLTKMAGDFIGRIVGPPAEQLGGLLADQIGFWRARNLNRLADKWYKEVDKRRIPPERLRSLPFGDAFRALEAASVEEEDDVQELWANLLANATDTANYAQIKKPYIDILKSIGSAEARLLNLLWNRSGLHSGQIDEHPPANLKDKNSDSVLWYEYNEYDRATAIQNLIRLQCIAYIPMQMPDPAEILKDGVPVSKEGVRNLFYSLNEVFHRNADVAYRAPNDTRPREEDYILTNLGLDLMTACSTPEGCPRIAESEAL
jgi:hypothetical protein